MPFEQKDNTGSLFKNDKKESETHADYNGSIKVAGVEYWLNAWVNKKEGKKTFFKLTVNPKMAREYKGASANPPSQKKNQPAFDDDIPF